MKRIFLSAFAILATLTAMAYETKLSTKSVGDVTISCRNNTWQIEAKVVSKGEIEEITIEMTAAQP